ncbi:MAG: DMT family transporter [Cyanobacteria bacterium J06600_6]
MNLSTLKTIALTCLALIAFAANSVLCRLALDREQLDASSFTILRLLSGIVMLVLISTVSSTSKSSTKKNWISSLALFIYAVAFSYAYISLDAGIGALVLSGTVQITMILASLIAGNKLHFLEWAGAAIAFSGFVYLFKPSLTTPSSTGFLVMIIAGVAWGIYTLRGRGAKHPIGDSRVNFLGTLPLILALLIVEFRNSNLTQAGIILALLSGAIASGCGYVVWYMAVRRLSTIQASVVQLLVPIIAALGGVLFAQEVISRRLIISSITILGGIAFVLWGQYLSADTGSTNSIFSD